MVHVGDCDNSHGNGGGGWCSSDILVICGGGGGGMGNVHKVCLVWREDVIQYTVALPCLGSLLC